MTAALAIIGHNNPPEATPFDLSKEEIENLFMEAKNWLDGEGVKSAEDADAVSKLLDMIRTAHKRADERRVEENKPFDDGKAAVQEKYAPLIADTKKQKGKTVLAMDACKAALAPWLKKLEAEKMAAAEAARKEAEEKAHAAQEALRASRGDLEAREQAEALVQQAKAAEKVATKAENDKAHATGGSRAVGLRTVYRPVMTDAREAAKHYWLTRREEVEAFFMSLAEKDVRAGTHIIPGFNVIAERVL